MGRWLDSERAPKKKRGKRQTFAFSTSAAGGKLEWGPMDSPKTEISTATCQEGSVMGQHAVIDRSYGCVPEVAGERKREREIEPGRTWMPAVLFTKENPRPNTVDNDE